MRREMNRIFAVLLILCLLISTVSVAAIATTVNTLYLKPNSNWLNGGARFAAYFFESGDCWVDMTDPDGDGIYECAVPDGFSNVIFCRMNPAAAENNWNNKWNQTADLIVPTNGDNCYTVAEDTWDAGGGTWSKLGEIPDEQPQAVDYYLFGYINGADYGYQADYANMGIYKFSAGKLTVHFETDSYVGIKTTGNANWYMPLEYVSGSTATFYNTSAGGAEKMLIPGGTDVTLTLKVNSDDTLTVSYGASQCSHSYGSKVTTAATCTGSGIKTYTCSLCGDSYTEYIAPSGHRFTGGFCSVCGEADADASEVCDHTYNCKLLSAATCTEYARYALTCTQCGHYTMLSADALATQWLCAVPTGMSASAFETKTVYSYRDLAGDWSKTGIGTVYYVSSWPSGFLTSDSLYNRYDNKTQKVTNIIHDTTKVTPESDEIVGYLYYHWCRSGTVFTVESQSGDYTQFHAYYSTKTPDQANKYDPSDNSYRFDDAPCCDNSGWFFPLPVYGQTYGTYYNQGGWGQWSEWSTSKVTANDTREVRSCTGYRYTAATLMNHSFSGGRCTVCGAAASGCAHNYTSSVTSAASCTQNGLRSYTCTLCGDAYTESIPATGHSYTNGKCTFCGASDPNQSEATYYLVGWINGTDHGCESDWENLGDYKFVNGKLTASFNEDSYVFVKSSDNNRWLLASAYCEIATCTFREDGTEKMFVPGGVELSFTLTENSNGSVTVSYTKGGTAACAHSYTSQVTTAATCYFNGVRTFTCTMCGNSYTESIPATGHQFADGYCIYCGEFDGSVAMINTYYLVGWINGADHGCEMDYENNGDYKFVNGQLSATFTEDSYVFVKTENNGKWFLADAYCTETNCTFRENGTEKMFVPGGVQLFFRITENDDGSVTVSYTKGGAAACTHSYTAEVTTEATCTAPGLRTYTCILCGHSYTQNIAANGHNFFGGICSVCGIADSSGSTTTGTTYYLVGYINGADHGCEADWQNLGNYRFVNGRLTAKFTQDSYVFVKTGDNQDFLLAPSYCEASTCTFAVGNREKMFVPAGVELTFVLTEKTDGTVSVSYTSGNTPASTVPTLTLKAPTLEFKDMITINAFYTAENNQDVVEMGMITYTSKVERWSVRTADYVTPGYSYVESSGRYYSSSQGIHGKYLADTFYLATYAKLADGSYVYSKLAPYSPMTYANSQLQNATDVTLKQLAVAMLNFGTEAQLYFGHNTGNLANAALNATHLALPEAYRADMVSAVPAAPTDKQGVLANNQGFASRKPAISFEGAFCINYFFTPNYAPASGITLYYWSLEDYNTNSVLSPSNATGSFKLTGSGTGEYRGDITGIAAKQLSEAVYVAAAYKDSNGTVWTSGVLGYSIGAYCSSQISKGGTIADLAKATAVYGYHAKAYFG